MNDVNENSSFTFWSNMKETIDQYDAYPTLKLKIYDAVAEYGLYKVWPENDGTMDYAIISGIIQGMVPSLDKSRNFNKNCEEAGKAGGSKQTYSDDQIIEAIREAARIKGKIPTRDEVVKAFYNLYGSNISAKTLSRRFDDEKKKKIALEELRKDMRDIGDVPETLGTSETLRDMSLDIGDVPDVPERHWNNLF